MPLPIILGVGAAIAGIAGVGSGIHGGMKMKDAKDTIEAAEYRHNSNMERLEEENKKTNKSMDQLGKLELEILQSFEKFSNLIEKIQNRPEFEKYTREGIKLPEYDGEQLKEVSIGAGVLLGGLGGAAVGTAGGFAAAGATTSAVMALGTASTGTAISTLSGAAATNATLAAIGGGTALNSGALIGGGMALGQTILGAATLGVGLLVGGIIFNVTGSSLSDKADKAWEQMKEAEKKIDQICAYLDELRKVSNRYKESMRSVYKRYKENLELLRVVIEDEQKTDWRDFSREERLLTQNTVLLVSVLYKMCRAKLVLKSEDEDELNEINIEEIEDSRREAKEVLREIA